MPTCWKPHVNLSQTITNPPCVAPLTDSTLQPQFSATGFFPPKGSAARRKENHQHVPTARGRRRDFAHLRASMDAYMHCPTATSDFSSFRKSIFVLTAGPATPQTG
uniref:DDX3Y n=1 Tax=Poeciliopsis prolifica TaxID=188132 RepID=A0A0S7EKE7_9TELE